MTTATIPELEPTTVPVSDTVKMIAASGLDASYSVDLETGGLDLISKYEQVWLDLCQEGPCREPFYLPGWATAFYTSFAPGEPVRLLIVRRGGEVRGILPMLMRSPGFGPVRLRWLHAAANAHFPRFDMIHGGGDADEVAKATWNFLREQRSWDIVQFESAPAGSVVWRVMELARKDRRSIFHFRADASPYISLAGVPEDPQEIIGQLSRRLRRQCRKTEKALAAEGTIEFQIYGAGDSPEVIEEVLEAFYEQEAAGWKGRMGTAIACAEETRKFYGQIVADALATNTLALCQLRAGGTPVAMQLNLVAGDRMYDLKSSYDESYQSMSPGHLSKVHTLAASVQRNLDYYDNLGRAEEHKLEWTDLTRPFSTGFIEGKTLRGRLAWFAIFRVGMELRDRVPSSWIPGFVKRMFE